MTTRETISKLYESLTIENIRGLNQKMLRLLSRKINCYEQYGKKPDEYYRCFESIEKEAAKDHSILIKREEQIEDDLKICWGMCRQPGPEGDQCRNNCLAVYGQKMKLIYKKYYEKEGHQSFA